MSSRTSVAPDVARRRAEVLRLSRDGLSLRAVAERLGVSKDTVSRDLAAAERATAGPPPAPVARQAGDCLTVHLGDGLSDDPAVLAEAGHDPQDAIRLALRHVADTYRLAWDYDDYPRGTPPRLRHAFHPYRRNDT